MNIKTIILTVSLAIASSSIAHASDNDVGNAIKEAKEAYKIVEKAGFAWRDTKKMIKKAEELAKTDAKKSIKLANRAKRQAELGMKQAEAAKRAGPRF